MSRPSDADTTSAVIELRTGRVAPEDAARATTALLDAAPIVAELYAADQAAWAYAAFDRALEGSESSLEELVIVGAEHVHVVQRLPSDHDRALVTIGPWGTQPGVVLASARTELSRRGGSR